MDYGKTQSKNFQAMTGLKSVFVPAILVLVISGCAASARFAPSRNISVQFESGQVLQDYNYYVGGPESKPNAIVAISGAYQLESEHWRPVSPTAKSLKDLTDLVGQAYRSDNKTSFIPNGARIVTPDGKEIATWYSVYDYSQVRLVEGNRVYLSYPYAQLPSNMPSPL